MKKNTKSLFIILFLFFSAYILSTAKDCTHDCNSCFSPTESSINTPKTLNIAKKENITYKSFEILRCVSFLRMQEFQEPLQNGFTAYAGMKISGDYTISSVSQAKDTAKKNNNDEFEPVSNPNDLSKVEPTTGVLGKYQLDNLYWTIGILLATVLAGVFVRIRFTRKYFRLPLLLISLVVLGFYIGGCPCMISSFENAFLIPLGSGQHWVTLLWFIGLLPVTYIFGQVWCGWVCHLGAFQEFLFKSNKLEFLKGNQAQMILKYMRYLLTSALILQLLITHTNEFCKWDPFKAAFNLSSFYPIGWYLLGLLMCSSLFISKPFCRGACPVGLILGWISKVPGASIIGANDNCIGCSSGSWSCDVQAINKGKNSSRLDNKECILCGKCFDTCAKDEIKFYRKSRAHPDVVEVCWKAGKLVGW